jgi:hypothetical protein
MGAESSRQKPLPDTIDADFELYSSNWTSEIIGSQRSNVGREGTTIDPKGLEIAGFKMAEHFSRLGETSVKILEPFAGNGKATKIVLDAFKLMSSSYSLSLEITIKSTDIQYLSEFTSSDSHPVKFGMDSVETIEDYGKDHNTLMMISPPPCRDSFYGDYFAIKKWYDEPTAKYLIFIGELGASDGSSGMYQYLMSETSLWSLEAQEMISCYPDHFGGTVEKELFIFKK